MFDDVIRDTLYALRGFRRAPLAALTIVSTVALGLGLVAVAFTVLNALLFRADAVPAVNKMFAVGRPPPLKAGTRVSTREQFDTLRRDTSVFTGAYAEVSQVESRVEGRLTFGTFLTGNAFQVLGVHAAMGRVLTAADDDPSAGQPAMVLSHRGWDRLFARDPAILGRQLVLNGIPFEIAGVMPEDFRELTFGPDDYWAPLSMLGRIRPIRGDHDTASDLDIIGRVTPGMTRSAALAQLTTWDARQADAGPTERGAARLTFVPRRGTIEEPIEAVPITAPLFFGFGLILLIGCANVANLLLARGVARQREIDIQLSLGATRRRIVRQLLTESLLLALAAAAAGFAISRVVLAAIVNAVMTTMPPDIGDVRLLVPDADWRVFLFLIVGAGISTIAFALAPALRPHASNRSGQSGARWSRTRGPDAREIS